MKTLVNGAAITGQQKAAGAITEAVIAMKQVVLVPLVISVLGGVLGMYLYEYLRGRNRDRILARTAGGLLMMLGVMGVSGLIGGLVTRAVVNWITGSDIGDLLGPFAALICGVGSVSLIDKKMEAIRHQNAEDAAADRRVQ